MSDAFTASTACTLAGHAGPYEQWPLTTPLLVDGRLTGTRVPGYVIEGQYRWRDHTLLITSYDCPFEESYEFLLLDAAYSVIARTSLGAPYATYLLHAHWPLDDASVRLHFYRRSCYTLRIIPPGRWRTRYRLALRRHLRIPDDARTRASIAELQAALDAIAADGSAHADGHAAPPG